MAQEQLIRFAQADDLEMLLQLKHAYTQCLYQGFLGKEVMAQVDMQTWRGQMEHYMRDKQYHVDVLLLDGRMVGYAIYCAEPDDPTYGLIEEYAVDLSLDVKHRDALVIHTLTAMANLGYTRVHQWVLRDNFRLRFLIEQFGFKPDGGHRVMERGGQSMQLTRYLYRMPGHEHEL